MKNILITEDDEAVRKCLAVILERQGYNVKTAENGKKAWRIFEETRETEDCPDLLITDIHMPEMGGFELIDKLDEEGLSIPSVVITGSDDRDIVLEALRRGCYEFIDKPLVVNEVVEKVESTFIKIGKNKLPVKQKIGLSDTQKVVFERSIGNYKLLKVLGEGAIGTVFLCERMGEKKTNYALKTLRIDSSGNRDEKRTLIKRFINESNAISQLNHPNIVNFIEFGYSGTSPNSTPYMVMEYFEGKSLKHFLRNPDKIDLKGKLAIVIQIADALGSAHSKNIFHRDIKPDNILVNDNLKVKITDFGICHLPTSDLTMTSELMGSPGYMAPEYLQHGKTNALIDIYALGVVAYELFVGVRPFEAESLGELMTKITKEYPDEPKKIVPDFPVELQDILAKMLKKNPKKRYQSAFELVNDLKKFSDENSQYDG